MSDIGILLARYDIVIVVIYNIIMASNTVKMHKLSITIPYIDRFRNQTYDGPQTHRKASLGRPEIVA